VILKKGAIKRHDVIDRKPSLKKYWANVMMRRCSRSSIAPIASALTILAVAAVWSARAAAAPEPAERFTHVAGINLADLPSFDALASRFGVAPVAQSGDGADYEARACYQTSNKRVVLEFFHGEVDWGFTLRTPKRTDLHCRSSAALNVSSVSIAGLELGIGKSVYERLVGKPQHDSASHNENVFRYVRTLTDTELTEMVERGRKNSYPQSDPEDLRRWDVAITLSASFTRGRLTSFSVGQVETN
jgi:hypothetical protein